MQIKPQENTTLLLFAAAKLLKSVNAKLDENVNKLEFICE